MAYEIKRVAILGAGVMGAGIAAHLANAGIPSLLYDIVPKDAGDDPQARNALALKGIEVAKKIKPAAFFRPDLAELITPLNYDDHADRLKEADLIIEVVVELLSIKQKVFEWVAANRRPDAIVSSNTSGIKLADMTASMPEDMAQHFVVTHFFNPVRYMRLLELVAGPTTLPEVCDAVARFGEEVVGKGIVWGKDTPNFVANRIGIFGIASVFKRMEEHGLGVKAVDTIFGPAMGRAKSAVFRTADIVGLDTLVHVFDNVHANTPDDECNDWFVVPDYVKKMLDQGMLGQKSGAGFYKKVKQGGKSQILELDFATMEYGPSKKARFGSIGKARGTDDPAKKIEAVVYGSDQAAKCAWDVTADILIYSANRIPEIADDIVNLDNGMKWGFGWAVGPFESWDAIGVERSVAKMEKEGREVPQWVKDMLATGRKSFYQRDEQGRMTFWSRDGQSVLLPRKPYHLLISDAQAQDKLIEKNVSSSLYDIGDGVMLLEFHSKMNSLDEQIFALYGTALDKLDDGEFEALVVGNQDARAYSAGANVLGILMSAMQFEFDKIDTAIAQLQALMMRAKYCARPVVTAPFSLALGGGAEVAMHSSATQAAGELYMGLVEVGVGLIPAGGGCKELIVRYLGDIPDGVSYDPNPFIQAAFQHIGLGEVSRSAEQARSWGFLRPSDRLTLDPDRLIHDAKQLALGLVKAGYSPPRKRTVKLPGPSGAAAIELFLYQMKEGGYASEHDVKIGKKLAYVLTGGDIPSGTEVTEDRLLELEREAFLSLAGEPLSQARMQHMLQSGKVLRN